MGVAEFVGVSIVAEGQDAGVKSQGIAGMVSGVYVKSAEVKTVAVGSQYVIVACKFFFATCLEQIDAFRIVFSGRGVRACIPAAEECR